jgi:O-antigen/teichoic acid export membrane protein
MSIWQKVREISNRLFQWVREEVLPSHFMRNVSVLTVAKVLGTALNIVQGVVVARLLGPTIYGVAGLILSYPGLVFNILDARSGDASVKYLGEFSAQGERRKVLAMTKLGYLIDGVVALATIVLVILTASLAAKYIVKNESVAPLIVLQAIALLPNSLNGTSRAILATLERFSTVAWIEFITGATRAGLIIGLVALGGGLPGVILGNAVGMALQGIVLALISYPLINKVWGGTWLSGSLKEIRGRWREIRRFLIYSDVNSLLGMVIKQLDLPILGYFWGPVEAGYYRLGQSIANLVGNLVGPLQAVAYPRLSQLYGAGKTHEMRQLVRRYALQVGAPLAGLVILCVPLLPPAISLVYGDDFLPSGSVAQLLLAGSAVWLGFFWLRPLFFARGEVKQWTAITALMVLLSLVAFTVVVPLWGFIGLASWKAGMQVVGHGLGLLILTRSKGVIEPTTSD